MSKRIPKVRFVDLGHIDYQKAWDYQTKIHESIKKSKREDAEGTPVNTLIFCEHPPVYTLGKSGHLSHLRYSSRDLEAEGISFYKINRGGDITYHGPGQLVVYPIFDLEQFKRDVHWYVRQLEEVIIQTLALYGITGSRMDGYTGVWIQGNPNKKICAIGVHMSRWVSLHGLAFNVAPNLNHFQGIIPCGIDDPDKTVTSMQAELKQSIDWTVLKEQVKQQFHTLFDFNYINEESTI